MYLKYLLGALMSFPLLPLMYYQGKKIRAKVTLLPEAIGKEGQYKAMENKLPLQFLFIGESTMAGVGVQTHEEGFAGSFSKAFSLLTSAPIHWKVYAKSGATVSYVSKKMIPSITETEADFIVIALGANDAFRLNSPWKWKREINQLIRKLRTKFPQAKLVFCNMPPIKDFPAFTPLIKTIVGNLVELLGKELQNAVRFEKDVLYCDENITLERWISMFTLQNKRGDFFSDGVHPSKLTYQIWAKDVAHQVYKTLWKHH